MMDNRKPSLALKKTCKLFFFVIILSLFILFPISCSKKEKSSAIRLIDQLREENVLDSPLKELILNPQQFQVKHRTLAEIADKFLLEDAGIGENPYLIKKKMVLGLSDINSLLAPPKSNFQFPVRISKNAFLEFTYGIVRDNDFSRQEKQERRVRFRVILETEKRRIELLDKTLNLNTQKKLLVFNYKKADLSHYAGEEGNIYFTTDGDSKAQACWFNPVIYQPTETGTNIILISLDTLRADHLSCYGYPQKTSPHIDLLAKDSVLFSNTFAPSPWTLPSHISLMTSLNTINHQVYYNRQKIDSSIMTLADFLRNRGYFTSAFTGGGFVSGIFGLNKGFDSYHVRGQINSDDSASKVGQAALEWIERNKDRDFFLFLHTYQIHTPYFSPEPYNETFLNENSEFKRIDPGELGLSRRRRFKTLSEVMRQNIIDLYDGCIRYTDEHLIMALIDKLKESNLYDRTMIILTSDHGEEFFEHKGWIHSHSVYNEVIKIPLIIKFPQSKYSGNKIDKFARLIDVMPTILDELDIDYSDQLIDGESLLDLIRENKKNRIGNERIFISDLASNVQGIHIPQKVALNLGQYKLILNEKYLPEDLAYFRHPPPQLQEIELYDLGNDPDEMINIAQKDPELTRKMIDFLKNHYEQIRKGGPQKTGVSDELQEQLKALGYIK